MKHLFAVLAGVIVITALAAAPMPGDEEDVEAVMQAHIASINKEESKTIAHHHLH